MKYLFPTELIYLSYIYIIARNRVGDKIKRYLMKYYSYLCRIERYYQALINKYTYYYCFSC